jgi:hypothetical protein
LDVNPRKLKIQGMDFTSDAQLKIIQDVWQHSFVQVNQGKPGITGLLDHARVLAAAILLSTNAD